MRRNPFEIKTPENNTADEVVKLFEDVLTDFNKILEFNHAFLNGPRGSGKSMMFRYMLPDCQMIVTGKKSCDLDYFSLYIPIKLTSINVVDLERLEKHANYILNEHLLVTYVMSKAFKFIADQLDNELDNHTEEIKGFYNDIFCYYIGLHEIEIPDDSTSSPTGLDYFKKMSTVVDKMYVECRNYCSKIAMNIQMQQELPYFNIPLVDYVDFMLPLFGELRTLSCFPQNKPFFLLIDDAGYLNDAQTKVLNTWVSYRTTKDICIKLSTQLDYKTYLTTNGKRIDSPHDYTEINIATIYTSSKNRYHERVASIVEKRLKYYLGSDIKSIDFFPPDRKQESEIKEIYDKLYQENYNTEKEYAGGDAARRYAIPEYIKFLKEKRSGSTYSYAGFKQLVGISSGIIRHFLAPASEMYSKQEAENGEAPVMFITDSIQNEIIADYSRNFINNEIEKCSKSDEETDIYTQLFNLIDSLGQLFHKILMSDCSERRVFSIALTDRPDKDLKNVLDKGVQLGFFHESVIGNKDGTGRNKLYVLSRVLAPYYRLDPSSFAGYQFLSSATLKTALTNTKLFLQQFNNKFQDKSTLNPPSLFD